MLFVMVLLPLKAQAGAAMRCNSSAPARWAARRAGEDAIVFGALSDRTRRLRGGTRRSW